MELNFNFWAEISDAPKFLVCKNRKKLIHLIQRSNVYAEVHK